MEGSVSPGPAERKRLLALYRKHPDAEVRRRAHIVLLLSDGRSSSSIAGGLVLQQQIGSMWMQRDAQAEVETPGTHEKRYLAGSLNGRTGGLIVTAGERGEGRNSALFVRHLEDLRTRRRRYRRIHVICDNARFHDSREVRRDLAERGQRFVLHFLPKYAPELNPIERIWWHLHEEITRNHQCQSMDELLDRVFDWLQHRRPFEVERDAYLKAQAA